MMPEKLAVKMKTKAKYYNPPQGYQAAYTDGFEACYNELEPLIKALKFYNQRNQSISYQRHDGKTERIDTTNAFRFVAKEALNKIGIE